MIGLTQEPRETFHKPATEGTEGPIVQCVLWVPSKLLWIGSVVRVS